MLPERRTGETISDTESEVLLAGTVLGKLFLTLAGEGASSVLVSHTQWDDVGVVCLVAGDGRELALAQ
jgi:hypothetical protein